MNKTPQFDKLLNEILDNLKPCKQTCQQCQVVFDISQEDIDFLKKLKVPPPTLCFDCRLQRRLGYRINFLPVFYKKDCSAPGHEEKIISFYSPDNPVKVYDDSYYLSDNWNDLEHGREYNFEESFFKQFHQLALDVPHQSLQKDPNSIDCDYVVVGNSSKNCYYVAVPYLSENIYYAQLAIRSKDCIDVNEVESCEQCYESADLENCYKCNFCYHSTNCLDSYFLYDCKNCSNCFGCSNLRNKKYYFFNQPFSKEEYFQKLKEIDLGKRIVLKEYKSRFKEILDGAIRKNLDNVKTEGVFGNKIRNSKNCFNCFFIIGGSENLRHGIVVDKLKDSMDFFGCADSSLVYESTGLTQTNRIRFSTLIRTGLELEYCVECNSCQYCFGCFGLRNKKFCIFNKQYSEEEYWKVIDGIKTKMLESGEYGEFFPLSMSWFPYNDSNASIEFPLTKEEVLEKGWSWQEESKNEIDLSKLSVLSDVPDNIKDVSDDILNSVIICEKTGKPFKITEFELNFYRRKNLPLPIIHPFERIKNRFSFRVPSKLWQYPCSKCGKEMDSGYSPEKKEIVYCEECYNREII